MSSANTLQFKSKESFRGCISNWNDNSLPYCIACSEIVYGDILAWRFNDNEIFDLFRQLSDRIQDYLDRPIAFFWDYPNKLVFAFSLFEQERPFSLLIDMVSHRSVDLSVAEEPVRGAMTIGYTSVNNSSGKPPERLIQESQIALKEAHKSQRSVIAFDPSMSQDLMKDLELERDICRALNNGEIAVYLQPKVDLKTGFIRGFEALSRWNHPAYGMIPPSIFVPRIERLGMGAMLDFYMLQEVVRIIAKGLLAFPDFPPVSVNVTADNLSNPDFSSRILHLFAHSEVTPDKMELEITETSILLVTPSVKANIAALQKAGIRVAVDDFGSGYTVIASLDDLNLDLLKIDKVFTDKLGSRSGDGVMRSIHEIARSLGIDTLVEGIENQTQVQCLTDMDSLYGQGFYFYRPSPSSEVLSNLKAMRSQGRF